MLSQVTPQNISQIYVPFESLSSFAGFYTIFLKEKSTYTYSGYRLSTLGVKFKRKSLTLW